MVCPTGEPGDDLALALIAPLGADHGDVGQTDVAFRAVANRRDPGDGAARGKHGKLRLEGMADFDPIAEFAQHSIPLCLLLIGSVLWIV